jgi:hypothetical protein
MMTTQCWQCLRYRGNMACDAFPKGIPEDIVTGEVDHSVGYPGDEGKTFQKIPEDVMESLEKSGDMFTDPQAEPLKEDFTETIAAKDDVAYRRVRQVLIGMGFEDQDFEPGGPFHGWSVNQLIDFSKDKRLD